MLKLTQWSRANKLPLTLNNRFLWFLGLAKGDKHLYISGQINNNAIERVKQTVF